MKRNVSFVGFLLCLIVAIVGIGCNGDNSIVNSDTNANNVTEEPQSLLKVGRTQVWADCKLFDSVVTPATFKPGSGNFDKLYAGAFKEGISLISESKPGDRDYNGGRWEMFTLKSDVPPAKYQNVCTADVLDEDDFEPTGNYFECPLLPRRGNN